jgi:hypothetical protein
MSHHYSGPDFGKVTQDKVGPHKDLLASFPYVGPPHKARSAEKVAA